MDFKDEIYTQISYLEDTIKFVRDMLDRDDFWAAKDAVSDINSFSDDLYDLLDDAEKEFKDFIKGGH